MNRELRNTLMLAFLAVAAGAYMYFVESERPVAEEVQPGEGEKLFPGLSAVNVEEVGIADEKGSFTVFQKANGEWEVRDGDRRHLADPSAVGDLVSALAAIRGRMIETDENVPDSSFGLDHPPRTVWFREKSKDQIDILIGGDSPLGNSRYIRVDLDGPVYVTAAHTLYPFERKTEDLREKKLVNAEPAQVFRAVVRWGEKGTGETVLERGKDGWKFAAGPEGKIDVDRLDDFLSELRLLRAVKFSGEGEDSFGKYGLDRPVLEAELYGEDGKLLDKVRFGSVEKSSEGTWTWSSRSGEIVTISKFSRDQMPSGPDYLMVKEAPPAEAPETPAPAP